MKKYLNKGLLYAWFNSAKFPIVIGLFIWGFVTHRIIEENLTRLKSHIAYDFSNDFNTINLDDYIMLGIIFVAIYFISKGANKKNQEMFLSSSPYTKKQIRYNELISLLITLVFFIIMCSYIAIMAYIRNQEFLAIVEGYQSIMLIEIARVFLLGIIGIIAMIIIDFMFSNSVIGFISMISLIPISILLVVGKFISMFIYIGAKGNYNLLYKIKSLIFVSPAEGYDIENMRIILLENTSIRQITLKQFSIEVIIALLFIVMLLFIFNRVQTNYKLESGNKIFSSKTNGKIIVILVSIAIGCLTSFVFISDFINDMQRKSGEYLPLYGMDLVKGLGVDMLCIGIVGFLAYKIINKVLRNLV